MSPRSQRKKAAKAAIDLSIHEALLTAGIHPRARDAFERLLRHVRRTTALLRPPKAGGRIDTGGIRRIIAGLLAMASRHTDWLRPVGDWSPSVESPLLQFGSLALHQFARYPV